MKEYTNQSVNLVGDLIPSVNIQLVDRMLNPLGLSISPAAPPNPLPLALQCCSLWPASLPVAGTSCTLGRVTSQPAGPTWVSLAGVVENAGHPCRQLFRLACHLPDWVCLAACCQLWLLAASWLPQPVRPMKFCVFRLLCSGRVGPLLSWFHPVTLPACSSEGGGGWLRDAGQGAKSSSI